MVAVYGDQDALSRVCAVHAYVCVCVLASYLAFWKVGLEVLILTYMIPLLPLPH